MVINVLLCISFNLISGNAIIFCLKKKGKGKKTAKWAIHLKHFSLKTVQ